MNRKPVRTIMLLAISLSIVPAQPCWPAGDGASGNETVILSRPDDPLYPLAEEIASEEAAPLIHSTEAIAASARYLLWVVSPDRMSDRIVTAFCLAQWKQAPFASAGVITGRTAESAKALYERRGLVNINAWASCNAANPAANMTAKIVFHSAGGTETRPLGKPTFIQTLRETDYLTFTGHGGPSFLRLGENTIVSPGDIPPLRPTVIATASCNTIRPWEENSIALEILEKGAAAMAGFVFSPNDGYLFGAFSDMPFLHTWPGFPIGRVVLLQGRETLRGFARFPYYMLLGDPRIGFNDSSPYSVEAIVKSEGSRAVSMAGVPAGAVPLAVPHKKDESYGFAEIDGRSTFARSDPFYHKTVTMLDAPEAAWLLTVHGGGPLNVRLEDQPPALRAVWHPVLGALDHHLIYGPAIGFVWINAFTALALSLGIAWMARRGRLRQNTWIPALTAGAACAALAAIYAAVRIEEVWITSKPMAFDPLYYPSILWLASAGALIFLNASTLRWKALAVAFTGLPLLSGTALSAVFIFGMNATIAPRIGSGLFNHSLGWLMLLAFPAESLILIAVFGAAALAVRPPVRQTVPSPVNDPNPE